MNFAQVPEGARLLDALDILPGTRVEHEPYAVEIHLIRDFSLDIDLPSWTKRQNGKAVKAISKLESVLSDHPWALDELARVQSSLNTLNDTFAASPKGGAPLNQEAHGIVEALVSIYQDAFKALPTRNTDRDTGKADGLIYYLINDVFAIYGVKADADATLKAVLALLDKTRQK